VPQSIWPDVTMKHNRHGYKNINLLIMKSTKSRIRNIPKDLSISGCSTELCQCEFYAGIADSFIPLHFGSYNTKYEPKMYRAEGTECVSGGYSVAAIYNKLPRNCDKGPFDIGVYVKCNYENQLMTINPQQPKEFGVKFS